MKKNIFYSLGVLLAFALVFTSCDKEDDYDFNNYTPVIIGGITGPDLGFASGLAPLTYSVTPRGGSTFSWSVTGIDAEIVQDAVYPSIAYITFAQSNENVEAVITVVETAQSGISSEPVTYTVELLKFNPIEITGFNGSWTGVDAYYDSQITIEANGETTLAVSGMSEGFISDWWGEPVVAGGTFTMDVNLMNGSVSIPRQHIYTTVWDGDNYDYDIAGTGLWDNTGAAPTLVITYDIYYEGYPTGLAETYAAYLNDTPYFTADIVLSNGKRDYVSPTPTILKPDFKK